MNADGTLELLGRGSVCINTAGEKVHPGRPPSGKADYKRAEALALEALGLAG